jgi:hypothetical protein
MASSGRGRSVVILAAGWICLASAALNWWNIIGVGVTVWRVFLAAMITLIGLFLLFRGFRASSALRSGDPHDTDRG